jgi:hypothetical protein
MPEPKTISGPFDSMFEVGRSKFNSVPELALASSFETHERN